MQFDPNNPIIKLCAEGMMLEGEGKKEAAADLFLKAWSEAHSDFEKFIAAHYVARHQNTISDKLKWDLAALQHAVKVDEQNISSMLPSLYLNVAKCYEDLGDTDLARANYRNALLNTEYLPNDGYGEMIKNGIARGIERVK